MKIKLWNAVAASALALSGCGDAPKTEAASEMEGASENGASDGVETSNESADDLDIKAKLYFKCGNAQNTMAALNLLGQPSDEKVNFANKLLEDANLSLKAAVALKNKAGMSDVQATEYLKEYIKETEEYNLSFEIFNLINNDEDASEQVRRMEALTSECVSEINNMSETGSPN